MRCGTARRRLSDALDGALPQGRKAGLEAHLRTCAACRAYRQGLGLIQDRARISGDRPPGVWEAFESSLEAKIDALEKGRRPSAPVPAGRRRLAWAVAAASVLAAVSAWYALQRQGGRPPVEAWSAYEEFLDPLMLAAEDDRELAGRIDREVGALIDEAAPGPDTEAIVLPAADPLFWEGLSDDDLRAIVSELEEQTGRGGPA
jgi:hypothetical protein